jgi:hypothetical protein
MHHEVRKAEYLMPHLRKTLDAWGNEDFAKVLREEVEQLSPHQLPLQQGLRLSSYVSDEPFQAIILRVEERADQLAVLLQIFYQGIIAGCNCADDPTPLDTLTESCRLEVRIDKRDAGVNFRLLRDDEAESIENRLLASRGE